MAAGAHDPDRDSPERQGLDPEPARDAGREGEALYAVEEEARQRLAPRRRDPGDAREPRAQPFIPSQNPFTRLKKSWVSGWLSFPAASNSSRISRWRAVRFTGVSTASSM